MVLRGGLVVLVVWVVSGGCGKSSESASRPEDRAAEHEKVLAPFVARLADFVHADAGSGRICPMVSGKVVVLESITQEPAKPVPGAYSVSAITVRLPEKLRPNTPDDVGTVVLMHRHRTMAALEVRQDQPGKDTKVHWAEKVTVRLIDHRSSSLVGTYQWSRDEGLVAELDKKTEQRLVKYLSSLPSKAQVDAATVVLDPVVHVVVQSEGPRRTHAAAASTMREALTRMVRDELADVKLTEGKIPPKPGPGEVVFAAKANVTVERARGALHCSGSVNMTATFAGGESRRVAWLRKTAEIANGRGEAAVRSCVTEVAAGLEEIVRKGLGNRVAPNPELKALCDLRRPPPW